MNVGSGRESLVVDVVDVVVVILVVEHGDVVVGRSRGNVT